MSILLLISIGLVTLTVTDVPRQMSLYRFPGFILLSCLFIKITVTQIVPNLSVQNKIIRIRIHINLHQTILLKCL